MAKTTNISPAIPTLPIEIYLLVAEYLSPSDALSLLKVHPHLSCFLPTQHTLKKGPCGTTILHLIAEDGITILMRKLAANPQISHDGIDNHGRTPLSRAAEGGHEEVARILLECKDVKPDRKDFEHLTPLSLATLCRNEGIIELLKDRGCDENVGNKLSPENHSRLERVVQEEDDAPNQTEPQTGFLGGCNEDQSESASTSTSTQQQVSEIVDIDISLLPTCRYYYEPVDSTVLPLMCEDCDETL